MKIKSFVKAKVKSEETIITEAVKRGFLVRCYDGGNLLITDDKSDTAYCFSEEMIELQNGHYQFIALSESKYDFIFVNDDNSCLGFLEWWIEDVSNFEGEDNVIIICKEMHESRNESIVDFLKELYVEQYGYQDDVIEITTRIFNTDDDTAQKVLNIIFCEDTFANDECISY